GQQAADTFPPAACSSRPPGEAHDLEGVVAGRRWQALGMDSGIVEGDRTAAKRHGEMLHADVETRATGPQPACRTAIADAAGGCRLDLKRAKLAGAAAGIAASAALHANHGTGDGKRNAVALCRAGDLTIGDIARSSRRDEGTKQCDCDDERTHLGSLL